MHLPSTISYPVMIAVCCLFFDPVGILSAGGHGNFVATFEVG